MEFYKIEQELGDLVNDNVRKLESIFPSVVKDGEVDFEELKELLGDFKEVDKEKYEMNWVGKKEAKKIALTPLSGKTLKYIEGDGKNEDTTENLYIEGDNLEVLKFLQNSYYGKVKMIYIDPPYNTGNDFVYNDNFREKKEDIDNEEGNVNEFGKRLVKNQKTSSHYHSKWMNMMYSRLLVCKNLLKDDGVIFISIDDNEVHNLRKICDEVFGEDNFIECLIWKKRATPPNDRNIGRIHEFILCYARNVNYIKLGLLPRDEKSISRYSNPDNDSRGPWVASDLSANGKGGRLVQSCIYPILNPFNNKEYLPSEGRCWLFNKEKMDLWIKEGRVSFRENTGAPFLKRYLSEVRNGLTLPTIMTEFGYSQTSSSEADKIFIKKGVFEYAKPTTLINPIVRIGTTKKEDIILDFFSGSATTAHAVMQLNAEDNGKRKFIMVQLPEETDKKSEAYKAGYKNICEIGKKRIRRAGDKILEENKDKEGIENLDIGFKVFRVENSNIRWQNQIEEDGQIRYDLDGKNIDDIDFIPGTKDIDVVYEILLRHYGIPLTAKIEKLDFIGNRTYTIQGSIIVCLETQITKEIVDKISELEPVKVIFRDSAFGDDISLKQNSVHRLNVLIEKNNKNTTHVVEFI